MPSATWRPFCIGLNVLTNTTTTIYCHRDMMAAVGTISVAEYLQLGVVSLTFRELSKIISRKYTTPKITFTVRISSWKFVRVPKAWPWAHVQSFSLKFSEEVQLLQCTNFERMSWRARETLVKQPPGCCKLRLYHQCNWMMKVIG